ncbi:MAG: GGDEF domain-containing protein [Dehalobacterium sp.]
MQFIKKIVDNLPPGIMSYFDPPSTNYTQKSLEAHPQLVKLLKHFLDKHNFVIVVYICIANSEKLKNSASHRSYNEIIRLFNQITVSHLMHNSYTFAEVITFHKISEDDFVIYVSFNSSVSQNNEEKDELVQELCFQLKLHIEQKLNTAIKHWYPDSLSITTGFFPFVPGESKKNLSRQIYSYIVQAVKISDSWPSTVKPIVHQLQEIIRSKNISIVYQPIVGIKTGEIIGYEALSRGPENTKFSAPDILFPLAEENGILYSLEKLCREQAIKKAQGFGYKNKLFLNINPQVINDPKFTGGITKEILKETGFTPQNLVFEITERTSIKDFISFKNVLNHYRRQGYSVAIDDAGAGYSSLQAVAELKPDYIKIDTSLIRNIDQDPVKDALLETFVLFSRKINAKLIAEGIERAEELKKLKELGVDYGQGFFLAKPEYPVPNLSHESTQILLSSKPNAKDPSLSNSDPVMEIADKVTLIDPETTVDEVYTVFEKKTGLEGLPIGKNDVPSGLIMRDKLFHNLASRHGFALYSKRPIKILMDPDPLIVNRSLSIEKVAHLAMTRNPQHLYDCVIVVDNGKITGTISVRDLLDYINNKQIDLARNANPLTGLPGNMKIQEQLTGLINQNKPFSVIYLDLDNFKAYNDKYGFEQGDQAILFTSEVLAKAVVLCSLHRPFIGHIGGDDFIIIMEQVMEVDRLCQEIIRLFDQGIVSLYDKEDQDKGGITSKSRTNRKCFFPFMSISCAVVDNFDCRYQNHLQIGEVAAELKKYAKSKPGSIYVKNHRS